MRETRKCRSARVINDATRRDKTNRRAMAKRYIYKHFLIIFKELNKKKKNFDDI